MCTGFILISYKSFEQDCCQLSGFSQSWDDLKGPGKAAVHLVCGRIGDDLTGLFFVIKNRMQAHAAKETERRLVASHLAIIDVSPAQNELMSSHFS